MKKIPLLLCGITLGSALLVIENKTSNQALANGTESGSLVLIANGEDFVRQGFVSKDGWQIGFAHVFVNMNDAIAYSTSPSFEPEKGDTKKSIKYENKVSFLDSSQAVDLAQGDAEAEPILVKEADAAEGFYNALSWKVSTADDDSVMPGKTILLIGTAVKDQEAVNFNLGFNNPVEYVCGEFVGDERQGIVTADSSGTVEATFHFDHIFGDGDTSLEEAINQDALGFQPIAELASNGAVNLDEQDLASQLSAQDYQKLTKAVSGLGHVGEGHCEVIKGE